MFLKSDHKRIFSRQLGTAIFTQKKDLRECEDLFVTCVNIFSNHSPKGGCGIMNVCSEPTFFTLPTCAIAREQVNMTAKNDPNNSLVIGNSFCFCKNTTNYNS
jgi:hypothetical protein